MYKVGEVWGCSCEAGVKGVFHWHTALIAGYERGLELADLETPNVAAWNALAPDVRNVLLAVRQACDQLVELFPPPPPSLRELDTTGFDEAFTLIEDRESKVGRRHGEHGES